MGIKDNLVSALSPLATAAPYHLLIYSTLLGTELYQVSVPGIGQESLKASLTSP